MVKGRDGNGKAIVAIGVLLRSHSKGRVIVRANWRDDR
jgi:hypothetical protein